MGNLCVPDGNQDSNRSQGAPQETCPAVQPASQNPIFFGSGNKFQTHTDFRGTGTLPLEWTRAYNSLDGIWRFSYSQRLELVSGLQTIVRQSDGKGTSFYKTTNGWEPMADVKMSLVYDSGNDDWTVTYGDDTVEVFDSNGLVQSITNRAGQAIMFTYTGSDITAINHFTGRSLTLGYTAGGRIASMTDPAGNAFGYEYDANGQLEYFIYPDDTPLDDTDNPRIQYHYEDLNNNLLLTGITDELGVRYTTYAYDSAGRATLSERAGSVESTSVVYNGDGTVSVTNELGKVANYTFVTNNGVRKLSQVDGQATTLCAATTSAMTYDTNGFVDTHTDENGNVTDYTYNARGLVESKTEASGTPEARTTTTTWHATLNVPAQIIRPGQTEDLTYDGQGRLLTRTLTDTQSQSSPYTTTGNTRVWTYTYNALGLVATIDRPRTDVSDVATYAYDANGDLLTVTNALGHVTEIVSSRCPWLTHCSR